MRQDFTLVHETIYLSLIKNMSFKIIYFIVLGKDTNIKTNASKV